jgi:CBS domain-containing protein
MLAKLHLPRLAEGDDPVDHLGRFHQSLRDVVAWASTIVAADGSAAPADARLLKQFVDGPLAWHLVDEELRLVPLLYGRRGPWLDRALRHHEAHHVRLNAAARALAPYLEVLSRGDRVPPAAWENVVAELTAATDCALAFEDDVIMPTARLLVDADERSALAEAMLVDQESRPTAIDLSTNAPRAVGAVHTLCGSFTAVRDFADCPKRRTVSVDDVCRHCEHLDERRSDGSLACALEATPGPRRVADVMTRDVRCVTPDVAVADLVRLLAGYGIHGVPVVDEAGAPIGVVSQSDVVRAIDEGLDLTCLTVRDLMMHAAFVVDEDASVDDAAAFIALEGIHRLPVVNAARVVVGIVSAMDLVRAASRSRAGVSASRAVS